MQIKRFKAKTMTEALRKIKNDFGPDAVILSARNLKKGNGLFSKQENLVEVTAATDSNFQSSNQNYGGNRYAAIDSVTQEDIYSNNTLRSSETGVVAQLSRKSSTLNGKKRLPTSNTKILFNVYNQLLSQHVDDELAVTMVRGLNEMYLNTPIVEDRDVKTDLVQLIEEMGVSSGRIKLQKGRQRIVALIGTSGVGKTTTVAKIAALGQKYLNQSGVGMITIDDYRIGAIEQAKIYAKIMGIEMEPVADIAEFKMALRKMRSKNLIVIDTPGVNPRNKKQLQNLLNYLTNLNPIEIHLLLGSNSKTEDMLEYITRFKILPISHLLFTKIDESLTYGNVLNQLITTKIPVSYLSAGHRVPEDFESATLDKILDLVLKNFNEISTLSGSPEILAEKFVNFEKILDQGVNERFQSNKKNKMELIKKAL